MANNFQESGVEVVLDNRNLIIAFALLIVVCGGFFVLGFVEGKRQGLRDISRNAAPATAEEQRDAKPGAEAGRKQAEERTVKEQLDWYKSVGDRGTADAKASGKTAAKPSNEEAANAAAKRTTAGPAVQTAPVTGLQTAKSYSVQIGAFRERKKAEDASKLLQSKGYSPYIEPSDSGVYFLRVGKFEARPAAVDLMRRLKKDGFSTIVKSN